ncbi:MAG: isopentenyl-diphosphate Delta-isomerase [Candidatus Aenigmarchaeota archaeon]|nr:isopentenyl-diphosphate Delta-isomerase [Candidatus Aenigmarchaeota archaeon]
MEQVILVDENDNPIGFEEKLKAHQNGGKLHRAFSILVFNSEGKLLIQRRASTKYHSPGLWANTCCSHPRPGEELIDAAHRRLKEECGFDTDLKEVFSFIYEAQFDNRLTEKELDHVLIGYYDGGVHPNPDEVDEVKWVEVNKLKEDMRHNPKKYAPWFVIIMEKLDLNKFLR